MTTINVGAVQESEETRKSVRLCDEQALPHPLRHHRAGAERRDPVIQLFLTYNT